MTTDHTETALEQELNLVRARIRAPRAAAVAGLVFSALFTTSLVLIRLSVPTDPLETGNWIGRSRQVVAFAIALLPFAGIAFLWFMAVLRDRFGTFEDRFFDTVFLGSGFLFVAMLFTSTAVAGALILAYGIEHQQLIDSGIYTFGRAISYQLMQVFAIRMAGVFMGLTSTLSLHTRIVPRWMAGLGYALSLVLLLSPRIFLWAPLVLPLWITMLSVHILMANFTRHPIVPAHRRGC